MQIDLPVYVFNTGAQYTDKGQRIAWVPLARNLHDDTVLVAFYDVDRCVYNLVRVHGEPSDSKVHEEYLNCRYVRSMLMSQPIEALLRIAASSI